MRFIIDDKRLTVPDAWEFDFGGFLKQYKASSSPSFDGSDVELVSNHILVLPQRFFRAISKRTLMQGSLGQWKVKVLAIFRWRQRGLTDGSRSLRERGKVLTTFGWLRLGKIHIFQYA